jgi:crotonobetainyl-CoA:carnitine CoA-transferase CaiB-like acyl-CoA transferase
MTAAGESGPDEAGADEAGADEAGADEAGADEAGALDGVRVLDLTGGVAGPVAGMLLADLGADVVKVYLPGGGPSDTEPGLHMWDRGKQTAVLDPGRPADLEALDRLAGAADVILIGTTGEAVSYDDLRRRGLRPGRPAFWIVMPPYLLGETPWAGDRESAGLLFAWLGHAWSQASYADAPVDCIYPLALHMQGIWAATVAVALLTGKQSGRTLAALAVAGGAHGAQLVSPGGFAAGRDEPHLHRPNGPGGTLPNYRCYRCADGRWLFFGAFTTAFIERGFTALGARGLLADPRVGGDPAGVRLPGNLVWIAEELEQVFARRPRADWLRLLEAADVPAAPVAEPGRWLEHEQVRAIGLRLEARNDAGQDVVMPGALIGLSRTPVNVRSAAATGPGGITGLREHWPARPTAVSAAADATQPPPDATQPRPDATQPPLAGLRVLNLGTIIAGPYVSTLLGELGADVIKVERPPGGDEFRIAHGGRGGAGFSVYNRGQRSILLDLTAEPGREVFQRLTANADVVVDNYRAGVARRLGIDHDRLAAANPMITSVSISAFGETGPFGHRPGFDPVVQAMSGIMRAQGGPRAADSPVFLTVPINDVLAAGLGALGACAALFARRRLGRGQRVSITLCAASCLLQSARLVRFAGAGPSGAGPAEPGGRDFPGPGPFDRLYQAADGWVRLGGSPLDGTATAFAASLGLPGGHGSGDSAASPAASASPAANAALAAAIRHQPVQEIVRLAAAAGLPAVRARQPRELAADRDLIRHGLLSVIEDDQAGAVRVGPGRWLEMPGLVTAPPGNAPAPGEHTTAIRRENGSAPGQPGGR